MLHFLVNQLRHEHNVNPSIINKIYNNIKKQEIYGGQYDGTTNFIGEITLNNPTYENYVNKIKKVFPELDIHSDEYYVLIEDPEMMRILMMLDISSDGIGIREADFDKIDSLGNILAQFQNNDKLTDTRVLGYFNKFKITENYTWWDGPWNNCINLKYAVFPKLSSSTATTKSYDNKLGIYEGCTKLEYVKFYTTSLAKLEHRCFKDCQNPNLIIDANNNPITYIGDGAFKNCRFRNLEEVIINYNFNNLEIIGGLYDNPNLEIVNIRAGIRKIEYRAFENCTNLTTFIVDEEGADITIEGATTYGPTCCAFYQTNIREINWHKRVKVLNGNSGGFTGNISTNMIFENETPPTISNNPFIHFLGKIYVPDVSLEDYKTNWTIVADKIYPISQYIAPSE